MLTDTSYIRSFNIKICKHDGEFSFKYSMEHVGNLLEGQKCRPHRYVHILGVILNKNPTLANALTVDKSEAPTILYSDMQISKIASRLPYADFSDLFIYVAYEFRSGGHPIVSNKAHFCVTL